VWGHRRGREKGHLGTKELGLIGFIAGLVAVIAAVVAIVTAIGDFDTGGHALSVRVSSFDVLPDGAKIHWGDAKVTSASASTVHLTVFGLSAGVRTLMAVGTILEAAPVVAVAFLVWRLCRSALKAEGFSDGLRRSGFITAIVVMVTGCAGGFISSIASTRAAQDSLGSINGWSGKGAIDDLISPVSHADIPLTPVVAGVLIALVAEIIARVVALQRDKARLQEDVSGLV
jgi:hypothetical protein